MLDGALLSAWRFLEDNPITVTVVLYVAINIARRVPPPKNAILLYMWTLFESAMFLTWDAIPGKLRLPGKPPFDVFVEPKQ